MKRYCLDQADWHVTLRGARQLFLFHDQEDYESFYSMMGYAGQHSGIRFIANCLMSNHFHLCLSGSSKQLTSCMWRLDREYSGYHNAKYGLSGHAFEAEYFREPIPSAFVLKRVVRYIHLNPVRAHLASTPEAYPWSTYGRLLRSAVETLGIDELRLLSLFHIDPAQARADYTAFVEKDLHRRILRKPAKNSAWEIWQEQFSWFLEYAEESKNAIYPIEPEAVAAWWAVKSGIPPRVIGNVLGHANGRHVSAICYDLSKRLERDDALYERVRALNAL